MSDKHKHSHHHSDHHHSHECNHSHEHHEKPLETESADSNSPKNQKNGDEILANELLSLKDENSGLKKVISEQNDKLLRSLADLENLRRKTAEELEKTSKYAISKFASDLVLVVENFYLTMENMPSEEIEQSEKLKNFALGVTMTHKELIKIFEKNNIKRINPLNEKFDHNFHEAIAQNESGGESGMITKVIQAGYSINDRLIRPALVEVSK